MKAEDRFSQSQKLAVTVFDVQYSLDCGMRQEHAREFITGT